MKETSQNKGMALRRVRRVPRTLSPVAPAVKAGAQSRADPLALRAEPSAWASGADPPVRNGESRAGRAHKFPARNPHGIG